jgi:hypothetical protein
MQITKAARSVSTVAASVVLGAGLVGCTGAAAEQAPSERTVQQDVDQLVRDAETYVGDPWEKRFRDQFWNSQHIHDSWNRCHLGENAPRPRGCDGTSLTPRR